MCSTNVLAVTAAFGTVKRAVFALYAITACFAALGVAMAATRLLTDTRVLAVVSLAFAFFAFISAAAHWHSSGVFAPSRRCRACSYCSRA